MTIYRDSKTAISIQVTDAAKAMIHPDNLDLFLETLRGLMEAIGATDAHICKRAETIQITVSRSDGWKATMKIRRG